MAQKPPIRITLRGERAEQFEEIEEEVQEVVGHEDVNRTQVWDLLVAEYDGVEDTRLLGKR